MEALRPLIPAATYLPVLVLTADITPKARQRALAGGAKDFLTKPFDPTEVLLRIGNLLETRTLHLKLQDRNRILEAKVSARTEDLEEAQIEILERLALVAEYRDDLTGRHTQRVGQAAGQLAAGLGLPDDQVALIRRAAPLHDVGKIVIPDHLLLRPTELAPEEFEMLKAHTTIGARILSGSRFPVLQLGAEIALAHHERWDGKGYPHGLKGEAIPLPARIVAVVDAFDEMINDRPYRKALAQPQVLEILARGGGSQWERRLVETFASIHAPAPGSVAEVTRAPRRGR
jgi:putative two-component system response regulator